MLYFIFENGRAVTWHVGEKALPRVQEVVEVQADCDELEYIKGKFLNIPIAKKQVVTWMGDWAKFIARNL
jgi:hypothetical protein